MYVLAKDFRFHAIENYGYLSEFHKSPLNSFYFQ